MHFRGQGFIILARVWCGHLMGNIAGLIADYLAGLLADSLAGHLAYHLVGLDNDSIDFNDTIEKILSILLILFKF